MNPVNTSPSGSGLYPLVQQEIAITCRRNHPNTSTDNKNRMIAQQEDTFMLTKPKRARPLLLMNHKTALVHKRHYDTSRIVVVFLFAEHARELR